MLKKTMLLFLFSFAVTTGVHAATNVYYSAGQNTTDHSSGGNVSIVLGVATFTVPQTAMNLGVGDRLTAGGNVYYIASKISTSQWNVVTKLGAVPEDLASTAVTSIAHEYIHLQDALKGATDSNHINNKNLISADVILNISCYYDSGPDTIRVAIGDAHYTTGPDNYLNVYTPYNTSTEVNQRQRHNGTAASGYTLMGKEHYKFAMGFNLINPGQYIKIIGLIITADPYYMVSGGLWTACNAEIAYNIVHGINRGSTYSGIDAGSQDDNNQRAPVIHHNITYNNALCGIHVSTFARNAQVYNNTSVKNVGHGITVTNNPMGILRNNLSCYNGWSDYKALTPPNGAFKVFDYNASSDSTASNWTGTGNRITQTFTFVDYDNNDFHLASTDTGAKDHGVSDPGFGLGVLFSHDIDEQACPYGAAWDMGADECSTGVTNVEGPGKDPVKFSLLQNYPNPANHSTVVRFSLKTVQNVSVCLFSLNGRRVETFASGPFSKGQNEVVCRFGRNTPAGIYCLRMEANGRAEVRKIAVIR
ncbi:MAG: T9SS type A sorting domain-containing protein [Fibrobacterota bacterium]